MSQTYATVLRKNLINKEEAPRYYAIGRSGRVATIRDVAIRIAERSSFSRGELEGCIGEFLLEMLHILEEGNIVQLADLGHFRMTIKTKTPTLTQEEFKVSCIAGGRVVFYPGKDFQKLCRNMEYVTAGKPKPGTGGEDEKPGGGDDGETPDPDPSV